jgi:signal transduction histidine kinase
VSTVAARLPAAITGLARRREGRLLGGVCAGIAGSVRADPTLVRLLFAFLAFADGAGILAYAGAWLALPDESDPPPQRLRRLAGVALLAAAALLGLRGVGIDGALAAAAVAAGAGVYLALRRPATARRLRAAAQAVLAALLVVAGGLFFLRGVLEDGSGGALVAPAALIVALVLVVGPWMWRLARDRESERMERIRAQERADMAARVHDSVLQTLALVQRSADDPKRVAALARRQERQLRGWLYGDRDLGAASLGQALEDAAADVEELHGVRVELVRSGDAPLDERTEALVLAAREAMANAAVHAGVGEVSVYVEATGDELAVYVRDRGAGFERDAVPADRRGLAESIEGRLGRAGGTATVRSVPGEGTEVELRLPKEKS